MRGSSLIHDGMGISAGRKEGSREGEGQTVEGIRLGAGEADVED